MHKCSICNNWVKGHYTDSAKLIDPVWDVVRADPFTRHCAQILRTLPANIPDIGHGYSGLWAGIFRTLSENHQFYVVC